LTALASSHEAGPPLVIDYTPKFRLFAAPITPRATSTRRRILAIAKERDGYTGAYPTVANRPNE
jgi:hypothetical protein